MKQKVNRLFTVALATILFTATNEATAQVQSMDIKTAIETALTNNYSLKADSMNLLAAKYQTGVVNAARLPQVKYSSRFEYNPTIASQMVPGAMVGQPAKESVPVQFGTSYGFLSSTEVTQSLFNKTNRLNKINAELNVGITQTKHRITQEELVYKVADAFYSLQATAEQIRLANNDYLNMVAVTNIAREQYNNGTLKKIDFESLEINTANLLSQLNQLDAGLGEQLTYFKYLLGLPVSANITIASNIKDVARLAPATPDGFTARQDLFLYQQFIDAKKVEIKSIKSERLPVFNSYFRYNYQSQFNNMGDALKSESRFGSSTVGLSLSYSIFDGYRRKSRVNIATAQLQQLRWQNSLQEQLASAEWQSAVDKFNKDRLNFEIARQNLKTAEKVFESRKALYMEGVTTLIELLDAERELSKSRNLHIQALINMHTGLLNMHKAKGTLLTEFVKSI